MKLQAASGILQLNDTERAFSLGYTWFHRNLVTDRYKLKQ